MNIKELKINCLGASNTKVTVALDAEGNKVVHRDVNYPSLLAARLGCTVRNYGVSGTNIAVSDGREDSYFERKDGMDRDADIVIVQGEVNDANHNIPLGVPGDTSPSTYCGAVLSIIRWVRAEFPTSKLIMLDGMRKARLVRTVDEHTHLDFHKAFVAVCELEGLTPISFYDDPMLDPNDKNSMPDGTHMIRSACEHYADKVADAVRKIIEID